MNPLFLRGFALLAGLFIATAQAQNAPVEVDGAWARASVPGQSGTGAFMRLTAGRDARLVSASSPVAGLTEVHEMALDNGIMKMRAVTGLAVGRGVRLRSEIADTHRRSSCRSAPDASTR